MSDLANAGATQETQSADPSMADIAAGIETAQSSTDQGTHDNSQSTNESTTDNVSDFQDFIKKSNAQNQELQSKVEQLSQQQNEYVNNQRLEKVNGEINSAVERINEKVGGDAEMAELYLEKQYKSNPDLKKVWDNRASNPDALNAALDLLGKEWAAKNQNIIDPQVAENQRALLDSQKSGGTVQNEDMDSKLANMGEAEMLNYMRSVVQN